MQVCNIVTVLLTCPKCTLRVVCRWRDKLAQETTNRQVVQNIIQSPQPLPRRRPPPPSQPPLHSVKYPDLGHLKSIQRAAPAAMIYEGNSLSGEYPHPCERDGGTNNMQQYLKTSVRFGQWACPTEQQYWPAAGMESHLGAGQSEMNDRGSHRYVRQTPSGLHVLAVAPQPLGGNEALLGLARQKYPRPVNPTRQLEELVKVEEFGEEEEVEHEVVEEKGEWPGEEEKWEQEVEEEVEEEEEEVEEEEEEVEEQVVEEEVEEDEVEEEEVEEEEEEEVEEEEVEEEEVEEEEVEKEWEEEEEVEEEEVEEEEVEEEEVEEEEVEEEEVEEEEVEEEEVEEEEVEEEEVEEEEVEEEEVEEEECESDESQCDKERKEEEADDYYQEVSIDVEELLGWYSCAVGFMCIVDTAELCYHHLSSHSRWGRM